MGETIRRYAVYWTPPAASPLAAFGAAWLGWDAEAAQPARPVAVPGMPRPAEEITATPRRYGFHATLKAPFRLAAGRSAEGLAAAVAEVAARHPAFKIRLELATLGRFLALVPPRPVPALDALARACVTELDHFRAPMEPGEHARRAAGLDGVEADHLARWGYPYVFDRFTFHLTLTGPLPGAERDAVAAALRPVLAPILAKDHPVAEIARFGEGSDGNFRILGRHDLAGVAWSG